MSGHGAVGISLKVVARNPCPEHKYPHWEGTNTEGRSDPYALCMGGLVGIHEHMMDDIAVKAFAQAIQLNLLNTNETIKDTSAASNAESANTAISAVKLHAGSGVSGVAFADYVIETPLTDTGTTAFVTGTVNAVTSTHFTVTGTFTNSTGANATYGNVGIEITLNAHVYLITHDQTNGGTGYIVSDSGTVAVTYTITFT